MDRDFKGVWIPKEIWLDNNLSLQEKCFLVEIDSLDNDKGCFASNTHFQKFSGLSKNRCSEIIKSLKEKNYITVELINEVGNKSISKRIIKGIRKIDRPIRKIEGGYSENSEGINTSISNTNINNNTAKSNHEKSKEISFENSQEKVKEYKLLLKDSSYYCVGKEDISRWKEIYENVDVEFQLKKMEEWCIQNPNKRKTRSGVGRFVTNWLGRERNPKQGNPKRQAMSFEDIKF